jgi:hypothetical protein
MQDVLRLRLIGRPHKLIVLVGGTLSSQVASDPSNKTNLSVLGVDLK